MSSSNDRGMLNVPACAIARQVSIMERHRLTCVLPARALNKSAEMYMLVSCSGPRGMPCDSSCYLAAGCGKPCQIHPPPPRNFRRAHQQHFAQPASMQCSSAPENSRSRICTRARESDRPVDPQTRQFADGALSDLRCAMCHPCCDQLSRSRWSAAHRILQNRHPPRAP